MNMKNDDDDEAFARGHKWGYQGADLPRRNEGDD